MTMFGRRFRLPKTRCALLGHEDLLRREPSRIFLECAFCGRTTRGWLLGRE